MLTAKYRKDQVMDEREASEPYGLDDLNFECSDEAIEAAAGSVRDKAIAVTLAFCSGLDTCPS